MPKVTLTCTFELPDQWFPNDEESRMTNATAYRDDPAAFMDGEDTTFAVQFEGHDHIYTDEEILAYLAGIDEEAKALEGDDSDE